MAFLSRAAGLSGRGALRSRPLVRSRPVRAMASSSGADRPPSDLLRASHILVSSKEMAEACKTQVQEGADFAGVAKSISECPSKARGGDLGWFKSGTMAPSFEKACVEGSVGDLVTTETEFGWHLIRIDGQSRYPGSMDVTELKEIYDNDDLRSQYQLVDVRERNELELASLDHFDALPMSEYEDWAESVESGKRYDRTKPTVVMCHAGMRSAQISYYLAQQGFENVFNLTGGIDAWSRLVDPGVPRY